MVDLITPAFGDRDGGSCSGRLGPWRLAIETDDAEFGFSYRGTDIDLED